MNKVRFQPSVRFRLTAVFGLLFFVTSALMLVMMYALVYQALAPPPRGDGSHGYYASPMPGNSPNSGGNGPLSQSEKDRIRDEEHAKALRTVRYTMGFALVAATLVSGGVGWYVSGRVLRPIRDITSYTLNASESTLGERLNLQGPDDELRRLADAIDGMLERLQASFESQRRFSAQASHELRTPLAIMGAEADVAMSDPARSPESQQFAAAIRAQVTRAERLVNSMMTLARSESTMLTFELVDISTIAGDVLGDYLDQVDARRIEIQLELEGAIVYGDAVLLGQLFANLIGNALKYGVEGGMLQISVGRQDGSALIRLVNDGAKVTDDDVQNLFRPFRRGMDQASREQGGFGLGLAIVRSVTAAHHGHIRAVARPQGGMDVSIILPLGDHMRTID